MDPITCGTRVRVDIAHAEGFADCAKAGFDGATGTVVDMTRDGDSPIYETKPGGRCVQVGIRPGQMRYQVRFDRPAIWPKSAAPPFSAFSFYACELHSVTTSNPAAA
jgi:hypothetical protein